MISGLTLFDGGIETHLFEVKTVIKPILKKNLENVNNKVVTHDKENLTTIFVRQQKESKYC